jgi:hypothetical protein
MGWRGSWGVVPLPDARSSQPVQSRIITKSSRAAEGRESFCLVCLPVRYGMGPHDIHYESTGCEETTTAWPPEKG